MQRRKCIWILVGLSLVLLFGCAPKGVAPKAALDTPEHHVFNGNKLFDAGKIEGASQEYQRARMLDPEFSPAYTGLGLVAGQKGDFEKGLELLKQAARYAEGQDQEMAVLVGYMRFYVIGQVKADPKWLQRTLRYYQKARKKGPQDPAPCFYMGLAYKYVFDFSKAAAEFKEVLSINREFVLEADREYAVIQKIERAMPGSDAGRQIAIRDHICRAEAAALFIEELNLDTWSEMHLPKDRIPVVTDIGTHVLKADIEAIIGTGLNGLRPYADHTFRPDQKITRAEFAMMIEDIIAKMTHNEKMATQFIGYRSPFPDVRNDLPYFNAIMVCTTRGILQAHDAVSGEFDPMGPVSGADALLSIRALKTHLGH